MKKLLSMALVFVTLVTLSIPAFAANNSFETLTPDDLSHEEEFEALKPEDLIQDEEFEIFLKRLLLGKKQKILMTFLRFALSVAKSMMVVVRKKLFASISDIIQTLSLHI